MAKFSTNREMMIDDIAVEIEKYDPTNDPQGNELRRLKLPKSFENLDYFLDNHKKLFNIEYYKFLEITTLDEHPTMKQTEESKEEVEREPSEPDAEMTPVPSQMASHLINAHPSQIYDVINECNEITGKMQREIQDYYRQEANFLNNLPRELINAILEHQNQNAR